MTTTHACATPPSIQSLSPSHASTRFIPEFGDTQVPQANSTLEGLLDRSSLMDVPYRGERPRTCVKCIFVSASSANKKRQAGRAVSNPVGCTCEDHVWFARSWLVLNTLFQRFVSRRTPEFWLDCTKTCELNCPPNPPLPFSLVTSGMQRQHLLVYLAALDEPLATGLESQINFQPYPGFNMATSGYADFFATEVTSTGTGWRERRSIHVFCVVALSDFGLFDRRRYKYT